MVSFGKISQKKKKGERNMNVNGLYTLTSIIFN